MLVLLVIVLVVFGAKRVPEIFEALGRGVRSFKKAAAGDENIQVEAKPGGEDKQIASGAGAGDASKENGPSEVVVEPTDAKDDEKSS